MSSNASSNVFLTTEDSLLLCHNIDFVYYVYNFFFVVTLLLVFPLSVRVLHLGIKRSVSTATTISHSDWFAFNMAVMELIGVVASILNVWAINKKDSRLALAGLIIQAFPWYGQMVFPLLTCSDRYLAVVHPVTYLRLRRRRSIRIVTTGILWLVCFVGIYLTFLSLKHPLLAVWLGICQVSLFIGCMTFCSLSAVNVLRQPRPGQQVGIVMDKSKQRAICIILIIAGVLLLKYVGNVLSSVTILVVPFGYKTSCGMMVAVRCFDLPSSCLLPLLFLHRKAK